MSKSFKYQGRVVHLSAIEHVGAKQSPKQTIVLTDDADQYPQQVPFEFFGEKNVDKLAGIQVGSEIEVTFDLRGREHNGRYYSSLSGWGISMISGGSRSQQAQGQPAPFHPDNDEEGEIF